MTTRGSNSIVTSETTFSDDEAMREPLDEIHRPGTVGFQSFSRGMQAKAKLNIRAR
jgi:hypothetical protein